MLMKTLPYWLAACLLVLVSGLGLPCVASAQDPVIPLPFAREGYDNPANIDRRLEEIERQLEEIRKSNRELEELSAKQVQVSNVLVTFLEIGLNQVKKAKKANDECDKILDRLNKAKLSGEDEDKIQDALSELDQCLEKATTAVISAVAIERLRTSWVDQGARLMSDAETMKAVVEANQALQAALEDEKEALNFIKENAALFDSIK